MRPLSKRRLPPLLEHPERDPFVKEVNRRLRGQGLWKYWKYKRYTLPHQQGTAYVINSMLPELIKEHPDMGKIDEKKLLKTALIHDVGKYGSSYITDPKTMLTGWQDVEVHQHPVQGKEFLERIPHHENHIYLGPVLAHHAWFGGEKAGGNRSYPVLKGDAGDKTKEIIGERMPLTTRIITFADSVDAMRGGGRQYRGVLSFEETCNEIVEGAKSGQFDPAIVKAFLLSKIRDSQEMERRHIRWPTFVRDLRGYFDDLALQHPFFRSWHRKRVERNRQIANDNLQILYKNFPKLKTKT